MITELPVYVGVSHARWNVAHPKLQDGPVWPALCEEQMRLDLVQMPPLSLSLLPTTVQRKEERYRQPSCSCPSASFQTHDDIMRPYHTPLRTITRAVNRAGS
jgi:hypothetical protein